MFVNFNIADRTQDYTLAHRMTDNMINMYGVLVKLSLVEKINKDDIVFGDYSHVKTDDVNTFEVRAMPENAENWDNMDINFSQFGMQTQESINMYISRATVDSIWTNIDDDPGFSSVLGNLVVLPSGRIMEITDFKSEVFGMNNAFTNANVKNAYKLILTTYMAKQSSELITTDNTSSESQASLQDTYDSLDNYFNQLNDENIAQDTEATSEGIEDLDDVFGRF